MLINNKISRFSKRANEVLLFCYSSSHAVFYPGNSLNQWFKTFILSFGIKKLEENFNFFELHKITSLKRIFLSLFYHFRFFDHKSIVIGKSLYSTWFTQIFGNDIIKMFSKYALTVRSTCDKIYWKNNLIILVL